MLTTVTQSAIVTPVADDEAQWIERGQKIRERREQYGITQEDLGESIGRSRDAVQDAEAGRSKAGIERIENFFRDYEAAIEEDPVDDDTVEIEVTGPKTAFTVVVRGKVRDLAELEDAAARMAKRMGIGQTD